MARCNCSPSLSKKSMARRSRSSVSCSRFNIHWRSVQTRFASTDHHWMLNREQLTEDRLLRAMDFFESDGEQLQRAIFQSVKQRYRLQNSGVIYDEIGRAHV